MPRGAALRKPLEVSSPPPAAPGADETCIARERGSFIDRAAARLAPGGCLVLTFRDYTRPPLGGVARFIPVRMSEERLMTCFIEDNADHVVVHDMVHTREGGTWTLRVGAYRKIKVSPSHVEGLCRARGLSARSESAPRGMVRVLAQRPA